MTAAGGDSRLQQIVKSVAAVAALVATIAAGATEPRPGAADFAREIDMRLEVPADEQSSYAATLQSSLERAGVVDSRPQYFLLVDRSRHVQAALLYWRAPEGAWRFIGAAPVSTGRPGAFDHFLTPLGVFEHSLANMDFRAEGTRNSRGILGYGRKGMRVYDFGWQAGERTWGRGGEGTMRLQMHATDPGILEPLLGDRQSKGCIRIPASLNVFVDRHGLLDSAYEDAARAGRHFWVLRPDRTPTPHPGRWLVVVESERGWRPAWSPGPPQARRASALDPKAC